MIIEGEDFKMELVDNSLTCFDLELLHVVNAKDPAKRREEFQNVGYGMTRETCIQKIIHYRLKNRKEVYTFKEYLDAFKAERQKIFSELNESK